jgi:hypothetical protein
MSNKSDSSSKLNDMILEIIRMNDITWISSPYILKDFVEQRLSSINPIKADIYPHINHTIKWHILLKNLFRIDLLQLVSFGSKYK